MTAPRLGVVLPPHLAMLVVLGHKTILDWPDPFPGEPGDRVAIIASEEPPECSLWEDAPYDNIGDRWQYGQEVEGDRKDDWWLVDLDPNRTDDGLIWLPLGVVVGTVTVDDALPIMGDGEIRPDGRYIIHAAGELWIIGSSTLPASSDSAHENISDQLPLGDFSPGRWGWRLSNPQPPTKPCPGCGGAPFMCDNGRLPADPIPCTGRQGVFTLPDHIAEALR